MLYQFLKDPVCRAVYYLYLQGRARHDDLEMRLEFGLWFLVHGRSTVAHPVVIPDVMVEALTMPDQVGRHALMNFAVGHFRSDLLVHDELVRAYYYHEGLSRFGSARLLGRKELEFLGECEAREQSALPLEGLLSIYHAITKESDKGKSEPDLTLLRSLARTSLVGSHAPSVSIIGFHRSVLGIGEDARCLFHALTGAGVRVELIDLSAPTLQPLEGISIYAPFEALRPTARIQIFCMPPFEMMRAIATLGIGGDHAGIYRIGIWPWETTKLPDEWSFSLDFVDEIWALSAFLEDVYRKATSKPVVRIALPVSIETPAVTALVTEVVGRDFCVITVFDFNSRIERKNPIASIKAFQAAFPQHIRDVKLILKTLNEASNKAQFDELVAQIGDDDRILIVDGSVSKAELCGLVQSADVYLSLHRSEGFGRSIVEAMLLGTPVVATQWSGPADYLTVETGFPIRSSLRPVLSGEYPFASGEWADPDWREAAGALKSIYSESQRARSRAGAAANLVRDKYSSEAGRTILQRLRALDVRE